MKDPAHENLPRILVDYIDSLIKGVGANRKVRLEVAEEVEHHFIDAMGEFSGDEDKEEFARKLISDFGDVKMLGKLIKRGKKRCRPLWRKVLSGSLYTVFGLTMVIILYSVWFITGEATFSVNYLARLNELARPKMAAKDNGWPDYDKAIELYVEPDEEMKKLLPETPWSELSSERRAAFSEWVDQNKEAWAHFVEASKKAYCYREYDVGDEEGHPMLIMVLLPYLNEMRDLSNLGVSLSRKHLEEGDNAKAIETCLTIIRVGFHWQKNKGTLIEQLVGQAIVQLGLKQMVVMVAKDELSSEEMARVQKELAAIFKDGFPQMMLEAEQLTFEDTVQHTFTEGGPGGGHVIPKMLFQLGGSDVELEDVGMIIIHASRNKTLAMGNKLYNHLEKTIKMSPWEKRAENIESVKDILAVYSEQRYAFIWWITPAIDRVSEIRYRGKALHDAALTILAVKRWQLDKGALPESLEQLKAEGYLKELPDDPYGEGLLTYTRRNGDFVLYSLADDFDDDGGKQSPEHAWGEKEEGGDRVFWPVQ